MPTHESLLDRIRQSPEEHLGSLSVSRLHAYFWGYDLARNFWGLPAVPHCLGNDVYREWLQGKVHLCRQSIEFFCILVTETDGEAFDLFFEFEDLKREECAAQLVEQRDIESKNFDPTKSTKARTLVDFILDPETIRKRPGMYLRNHRHLSQLWTLRNGFLWAERDLGVTDSSDAINFELFQLWLDDRFPLAKGQPWDKLFYFECIDSDRWAMEQFYENFEMFLAGKTSDAPAKWVETAIENIKKQMGGE